MEGVWRSLYLSSELNGGRRARTAAGAGGVNRHSERKTASCQSQMWGAICWDPAIRRKAVRLDHEEMQSESRDQEPDPDGTGDWQGVWVVI